MIVKNSYSYYYFSIALKKNTRKLSNYRILIEFIAAGID